jgi:flagellar basal-body rod protein FlgG
MNGAFYVGATGLQAQQRALDVIANNISNINTNGFKRSEIRFAELLSQDTKPFLSDAPPMSAPEVLSGVQARAAMRVFEQGDLRETGQPLDLAVSGDGFIETLGPNGEIWLWRGGALKINADRLIETDSGLLLKAMIEVPQDSVGLLIGPDGVVSSISAGSGERLELGALDLAMPSDPHSVEAVGDGFYRISEDEDLRTLIAGEDGGVIVQGSIETSNVELTTEMVTLLLLQRAYGANAQVVQAGDQLMSIANNLRR